MLITIHENGTLEMIANPALDALASEGRAVKTRASHVLPCNVLACAVFKFLRYATGETGLVSDWTRRWHWLATWGWQVQIVNGPNLGTFWDRSEAIAAEVAWIEKYRLSQ